MKTKSLKSSIAKRKINIVVHFSSSGFHHPTFNVIRIFSSAFYHLHFGIRILSSAFYLPHFVIIFYHPPEGFFKLIAFFDHS